MLSILADKTRAAHAAVLIVDVQNDSCAEGGAMPSQFEHGTTLANIDAFFGQVVTADEIVACWQPAPTGVR